MGDKFSEKEYRQIKEQSISGRYLTLENIEPIIKKLSSKFKIKVEGFSEENQPLYSITYGKGDFKILMWSQMHGNESTTTKAIFDLLNFLNAADDLDSKITLKILPMLNPDGALRYTRENANGVDLNRDALNKSQIEIKTLFSVFEDFKPDLCLNMHDQRSIFSSGKTSNPAVVSFLAPAADENKSVPANRAYAMQLIAAMSDFLQNEIPDKVGRYSDDFNPNCLGDAFQSMGVPAILFEAGHIGDDYERENTRMYLFMALWYLFNKVLNNDKNLPLSETYFVIPENQKLFYDLIIKDASVDKKVIDIAVQFEEKLFDNSIQFIPKVAIFGDLSSYFSHKTINAQTRKVKINDTEFVDTDTEIVKLTIGDENISMI